MSGRIFKLMISALIAILVAPYMAVAQSPPGGLGLRQNRDRLLDGLARQAGGDNNRCSVWNSLGSNQKGVFLTITDNFWGAWLYQPMPEYTYECVSSYPDPQPQTDSPPVPVGAESGHLECPAYDPNDPWGGCGGGSSGCSPQQTPTGRYLPREGYQAEKMLDHVNKIFAMAADTSSCGGSDNRFWFQADDALIYALRNIDFSAPTGWRRSEDWGGPHSPFTQSRETNNGKPRGQTHEFAWDYEAVWFTPGVSTPIFDPHLVEIDMDYNFWHDSNPECYYQGEYGRDRYVRAWSRLGYPSVVYSYSPDRPAGPKCTDDGQFFVKQLYRDFLLHESDPDGLAYWQALIDQCNYDDACMASQQAIVARAFASSEETRNNNPEIWASAGDVGTTSYNHAFIQQLYRGFYHREPESSWWEENLNQSGDYLGVTAAFVQSAEYTNRFPTSGAW